MQNKMNCFCRTVNANKVFLDPLDFLDHRVKAYLDHPVLQVQVDLQVKVCQVEMVCLVEMVFLVYRVQLEIREQKAILESPVKV